MPRDPQALATMLEMAVKAANAPLLSKIATLEAKLAALAHSEQGLLELRDRVTVMETKAVVVPPELPPPVDVMPLVERIVALETFRETNGDLRDRVVAVETKAAHTVQHETKAVDFSPLTDRLGTLEIKAAGTEATFATVADIAKDVTGLRERMAAVEARPVTPGPAGPAGKDGLDGKDGADGLGFDSLEGEYDARGHLHLKFVSGNRVKDFRVPDLVAQGRWQPGLYVKGDVVVWDGSSWTALEDTAAEPGRPEAASRAWQLSAKKGERGKNLTAEQPAPQFPVVSVNAGR